MKIQDLFLKPIDRFIEGVIKADDEAQLANEVEEYIITNEIAKNLQNFFEVYNEDSPAIGAWISGFFGSGKSHLLKILSLVLENREIDGMKAGEVFCAKISDAFLRAEVEKTLKTPSRSILFNIDQKSDKITKTDMDAILSVFLKVFNEMQGFYPQQPYIAQFERDLFNKGQLDEFKSAFESEAGEPWETGRETAHLLNVEIFAKAYATVNNSTIEEGSKILDRYRETYRLDIEGFAKMVKDYIDKQEPGFRLNFFVDEVGQYIADSTKLMVNLQTIAESLSTKCRGRSWILVTSQEDMTTVVGDLAKVHTSNDFTKIQDRFRTRLPLTGKDVSEVIQKRLLAKDTSKSSNMESLSKLYEREKSNFRTLFEFGDGSRKLPTYTSEESFVASYPFVPYQFDLFQAAINELSRNNAFTGKHASVGERSMLGVFQEVAKRIAAKPLGHLATFDFMYEGIRAVIKSQHQKAVLDAERQVGNELAQRILKSLFLVKYIKEFKGTPRNLAILSIDSFDIDLASHEKSVREALNVLEQNTFVHRTGEVYEFLTNEEKDIENEIKATDIDDSLVNGLAAKFIYDEIIRDTKIRYKDNEQDYWFTRKLDGTTLGRDYDLSINVISPFHDLYGDETAIINQSIGKLELLLFLPSDTRLLSDLNTYAKTHKYILQNSKSTQADSRQRVLYEKGQQNLQRKVEIRQRLEDLLSRAKAMVGGNEVHGLGAEARNRVHQAFDSLVRNSYPNLKMLRVKFGEDSAKKIISNSADDLFRHDDDTLSEGETEILSKVKRKQAAGERPTVQTLTQDFGKAPYGWYNAATLAILAKLFMRGKIELRADSNILDKDAAIEHLTNTRLFTNTIVFQQETFDARAIHKLKQFHSEFFDKTITGTEAKEVATTFILSLKTLVSSLTELSARTKEFPFVAKLKEPLETLRSWSEKEYTVFLKELKSIENDWLDAKEDLIDPIVKFVHGPQKDIFEAISVFYQENKANLQKAAPESVEKIETFLASDAPYEGTDLRETKKLIDDLQVTVAAELEAAKNAAKETIQIENQQIEKLPGFEALDPSDQAKIKQVSEKAIENIEETSLIAVARDTLNEYQKGGYASQLETLNTLLKEESKKEGSTQKAPSYVPSQSIQVKFAKSVIESETDLEAYLEVVRAAYSSELEQNKKITL